MSKKSNKKQGKEVKGASLSSDNKIKSPEMLERGLGSAFAIAVANLTGESESLKGSKNSFLGVEKIILDPKEHSHSLNKK